MKKETAPNHSSGGNALDNHSTRHSLYSANGVYTRTPTVEDTTPEENMTVGDGSAMDNIYVNDEYAVNPSDGNEGCGDLPATAPLANPYVPFQRKNAAQYLPSKGVMRGTLFPGLDLPFHAMVNDGQLWGEPLAELMALDFAIKELQLYLDTHPDDTEALNLMVSYTAMQNEGAKKYVSLYGPINITQVNAAKGYTWIKDPWPWEYNKEGV